MSYDYDRRMKIARGEGMGAWDGQDHYWPEMHDWEFSGDSYDRFGDAYRGTYQYISRGGHYIDVFVHFDRRRQPFNRENLAPIGAGGWVVA